MLKMFLSFIKKNDTLILYALSLGVLLFFLKFIHLKFIIIDHAFEIYIGLLALVFMGLGVWVALRIRKPHKETIIIEKKIHGSDFIFNAALSEELGLSKRELEVLELMAAGLSNQEIGDRLFVSLNTVKTHSRRIFEKLSVVRRAQAIDKAKKLMIIP